MITKKNFSDALRENASVVEGLIPIASTKNNGLMSSTRYIMQNSIIIKEGEILRICSLNNYERLILSFSASVNRNSSMGFVTFFPSEGDANPLFNVNRVGNSSSSMHMYYRFFEDKHEYLVTNEHTSHSVFCWNVLSPNETNNRNVFKFDFVEANIDELTLIKDL